MPELPVKCTRCGAMGFTSNLIGGSGSGTLHLTNVTMGGACPECGGDMRVIDGVYDMTSGVITAFRALGVAELKQVQTVLEDSRAGRIDALSATAQVAAVSPDMAALIAVMQGQRQWNAPTVVNALLAALAVVLAWMALHQATTLTGDDHEALQHDIRQAIEQVSPAPTPAPALPPGTTIITPPASPMAAKRQKRPSKTFGKHKRKKRHGRRR